MFKIVFSNIYPYKNSIIYTDSVLFSIRIHVIFRITKQQAINQTFLEIFRYRSAKFAIWP